MREGNEQPSGFSSASQFLPFVDTMSFAGASSNSRCIRMSDALVTPLHHCSWGCSSWVFCQRQAGEFRSDNPLNQPGKIYWCPNRAADKRITTTPDAGCTALYDAERDEKKATSPNQEERNDSASKEPSRSSTFKMKPRNSPRDYREFLDCCASEWDSPRSHRRTPGRVQSHFDVGSTKGIYNSAGFGVGSGAAGLGGAPANLQSSAPCPAMDSQRNRRHGRHCADDLKKLRTRMKGLITRYENSTHWITSSAGEERRIEDEREAIAHDLRPKRPAASAPTGMEIQDTTIPTRIGGDIENSQLNRSSTRASAPTSETPSRPTATSTNPCALAAARPQKIQCCPIVSAQTQDTTLPNASGFRNRRQRNEDGSSSVQLRGVGPSIGDSSSTINPAGSGLPVRSRTAIPSGNTDGIGSQCAPIETFCISHRRSSRHRTLGIRRALRERADIRGREPVVQRRPVQATILASVNAIPSGKIDDSARVRSSTIATII